MIRTTALTLALVLAACAPEAPQNELVDRPSAEQPVDPNALTSTGMGAVQIGMTRAEVISAWGDDVNPSAVGGPHPEECDLFHPAQAPAGVLVMIQDGRLTRISATRDSSIATDRGFGIGDSAQAIKQAYGAEAQVSPHAYQEAPAEYVTVWASGAPASPTTYVEDNAARGIRYEIGGEGAVTAIHAGGPSIQYVEGCA